MIRFEEVTKRYPGGSAAVSGLSLEIPSNKITVFVGPSGCGKTTSLRMINRMTEPTSGRVFVDDIDTSTIEPTRLRRGIGYVIQQAGLFPNKTVLENVMTVPLLHHESRSRARSLAREWLGVVGLGDEFEKRYPAQLSGGQQQRVGVARALAADPPILLMDEPFSAVDPVVRAQLQEELLGIQRQLAKTIVFVTHDIDEAIKIGDFVAVMEPGGHLAQFAPPQDVLARPANGFVAEFVGRDRGYRALGFMHAPGLPLEIEHVAVLGTSWASTRAYAVDNWVLVVDKHSRPLGWLDTDANEQGEGLVTTAALAIGGTLAHTEGTMRELLDSALSSPSGRAVVVFEDGSYCGTIRIEHVLDSLSTLPELRMVGDSR